MSEQNKSNVQALGAGLLGFVAVMAVGGGALLVHSWIQSRGASKPIAAAAPIDLGSTLNPPVPSAPLQHERRTESPAPLTGEVDENEAAPSVAPGAPGAPGAPAAPAATPAATPAHGGKTSAPVLDPMQRSDSSGGGSSAPTAVVKKTGLEPRSSKIGAKRAVPKLVPSGSNALASIHYGVTDRSELMGKAAGPVYNMKGSAQANSNAASSAAASAADMDGQMAEVERKLTDANLPPDQRAELLKQLAAVKKAAGVKP